jgi:hypothetical protein
MRRCVENKAPPPSTEGLFDLQVCVYLSVISTPSCTTHHNCFALATADRTISSGSANSGGEELRYLNSPVSESDVTDGDVSVLVSVQRSPNVVNYSVSVAPPDFFAKEHFPMYGLSERRSYMHGIQSDSS